MKILAFNFVLTIVGVCLIKVGFTTSSYADVSLAKNLENNKVIAIAK